MLQDAHDDNDGDDDELEGLSGVFDGNSDRDREGNGGDDDKQEDGSGIVVDGEGDGERVREI